MNIRAAFKRGALYDKWVRKKQEENIVFEIFSHSNIKQQLEQIFDKNW